MTAATDNLNDTYTTNEACELSGATLRQTNYWCYEGWITPHHPAGGSGSRRAWSAENLLRLRAFVRLQEILGTGPTSARVEVGRQIIEASSQELTQPFTICLDKASLTLDLRVPITKEARLWSAIHRDTLRGS